MKTIGYLLIIGVALWATGLGRPETAGAATNYVAYDISPSGSMAVANCTDGTNIGGCTLSKLLHASDPTFLAHVAGVDCRFTAPLVWSMNGAKAKTDTGSTFSISHTVPTDCNPGSFTSANCSRGNVLGIRGTNMATTFIAGWVEAEAVCGSSYTCSPLMEYYPGKCTTYPLGYGAAEAYGVDGNFMVGQLTAGTWLGGDVNPAVFWFRNADGTWPNTPVDLVAAEDALAATNSVLAPWAFDGTQNFACAFAVQGTNIVGMVEDNDAVCWRMNTNGTLHDVLVLAEGAGFEADARAVSGDLIVGESQASAMGSGTAWLWFGPYVNQAGQNLQLLPSSIGGHSCGYGVSKIRNEVVGFYNPPVEPQPASCHARVWNLPANESTWTAYTFPNTAPTNWMVDLNNFLPAPPTGTTWGESCAYGIDDQGDIVGFANSSDGKTHAILWVPVASPTPPAPPTGLQAVAANGQITLSWTASTGAASYYVKRATVSGAEATLTNVTATTFINSGLAGGTKYYYVVTATNSAGESANSAEVSATTPVVNPPSAPTGLTVVGTNYQINVAWNAVSGATSYNVKRAEFSGSEVTFATTTTPGYTDTAAIYGIPYYYLVTAVNGSGESGPSGEAMGVTLPNQPFNVSATGGNGQVFVNWTGVYEYMVSYHVKRSTISGRELTIATTATPGYTDTVTNGTTYYYKISAVNPTGEGANSLEVSAAADGNLILNGGFESGDFTGWSLSGDLGNTLVDGGSSFGISPHAGQWAANLGTVSATGYISQRVATTPGTSYTVSFWVNNSLGDANTFQALWNGAVVYGPTSIPGGGWINIPLQVTATGTNTALKFGFVDNYDVLGLDDVSVVAMAGVPLLQAVGGNGQVSLSWPALPGAMGYYVQRATNSGQEISIALAPTTAYTDTNVVNGRTYFYRVQGVSSNGVVYTSEASATPGATVTATSPKLTGLNFPSGGGFGFSFTNVSGGTFRVYATTNLAQPFANWTPLGAPAETVVGAYSQYQFTDSPTNSPGAARFYRVSSQ